MYERSYEGERMLVVCSFAKKNLKFSYPGVWKKAERELLLCNYVEAEEERVLRPYEARVYALRVE